ncbi:RagB/SusD family nutrient uptake outer membrane protein [Carboxylicivirga sediminis]|uniref:RagB/SusD family nutrient uptake outer membrane protein n=1 Tax=Carboxylicivirga sediminis TaxID=2006564 RepID=A0A941F0G5_9BACT|nr:RagB/SusD family nutrient uptake outer membrane protein [Carboxylicivirga sediminis]MBR8534279.1 RagB/SusD family nutrient uptake outer membrane protein [Carboxylicivirga sediminis]
MKKYTLIVITILGISLGSCQDWLDVQPISEVSQDNLFETEDGYMDALNGIYLMMSENAVYGKNLTAGFVDVMAQNYFIFSDHQYIDLAYHNYETEFIQNEISSIWSKAYNIIANCNTLIEHIETADDLIFTGDTKSYIYGEAVAIRALVHFDMLRLFNLPYLSDSNFKGIPYVTEFKKDVTAQLSTDATMGLIIDDLETAYHLLEVDEIKTEGERGNIHRENRLNAYAVAALLARVHLYSKDYANAEKYASEVIDSERFAFVNGDEILLYNDYTYYNEHIFGLYTLRMSNLYSNYFNIGDLEDSDDLMASFRMADWYDGTDVRFKYWFEKKGIVSGTVTMINKYKRPSSANEEHLYKDPSIPIIRLPEMYLILAEAQAEYDLGLAITTLNMLKTVREASPLDENADFSQFQKALQSEYEKEFYSEGQLFYYYKRMNMGTIVAADGTNMPMNDAKYTLPLPANEIQFGGR